MTKVDRKTALELFKRIYAGSPDRTLVIDDGSASGWEETDGFSKVGEEELLINDIQTPENLFSFFSVLREYYANRPEETFFFLQEESLSGIKTIDVECDLSSLDAIVEFVDDAPNLNAILFDASFTWALKFHHELFGYFSGPKEIWDRLRKSESLTPLVVDPVWL